MPESYPSLKLHPDQIAEIKLSVKRKAYEYSIEIIEEMMANGDIAPDSKVVKAEMIARTQAFYGKAHDQWKRRADRCLARNDLKMHKTNTTKANMATYARLHCYDKYLK